MKKNMKNQTIRRILFSILTTTMILLSLLFTFLISISPLATANVSQAAVMVTPSTAGTPNASYEISFTVRASGALTRLTDWINITFASGTSINQIVGVNGTVSNGTCTRQIDMNYTLLGSVTLNITLPVNISNNGTVWVNLSKGLKNPLVAGTYNISINTSKEPTSIYSQHYSIIAADSVGTTNTSAGVNGTNASQTLLDDIYNMFGLILPVPFYANDTNGDGIADTFTDPNNKLVQVRSFTLDGNASFLLSKTESTKPEYYWNTVTNIFEPVIDIPTSVENAWIDAAARQIIFTITVEKAGWIYLQFLDTYPLFDLVIKTSDGRTIPHSLMWRENGMIYLLDDPSNEYIIIYSYAAFSDSINLADGTIFAPTFYPADGAILDDSRPTIRITYFEDTVLLLATLNNQNILDQITVSNQRTYVFTPASELVKGAYMVSLTVQDIDGNTLTSSANYIIRVPSDPTQEIPWLIIIFIGLLLSILMVLIILRRKLLV